MTRYAQWAWPVLASAALVGCTSMQSVVSTEREAVIATLERGDRVDVLTREGWRDKLAVVGVTDAALQLETWDNEPVTIARADVWDLRIAVPSKHKTGALAGAIVGGVLLGLLLADGVELEF